jgi:hypothetical protein
MHSCTCTLVRTAGVDNVMWLLLLIPALILVLALHERIESNGSKLSSTMIPVCVWCGIA